MIPFPHSPHFKMPRLPRKGHLAELSIVYCQSYHLSNRMCQGKFLHIVVGTTLDKLTS